MKEILDANQEINPYLKLSILALSVATSLVSLAWSLVVYHRSLRYTFPDKKNISLLGTVVQFLWNFSWITARVLALSLFASCFPMWIGPLAAVHWMLMSAWVVYQVDFDPLAFKPLQLSLCRWSICLLRLCL